MSYASTRTGLLLAAAFLGGVGTAFGAPAKAPVKTSSKKPATKPQKKPAAASVAKLPTSFSTKLPVRGVRLKPRLPLETVLLFRNTDPSAPPGTFVMLGGFLNFVRFGPKAAEPVDTWYIELDEPVNSFSSKFSPDARYVSFGVGWPWDPPYLYKLYFFDRQTQRVLAGPPESTSWQLSYWAPDSDKLAFLSGDELRVYSLKERKSFFIVSDPGVNDMAWTEQNTLLVTRFAARKKKTIANPTAKKSGTAKPSGKPSQTDEGESAKDEEDAAPLVEDVLRPLEPSIFEFAATSSDGKLVLEGARYAVPSPDGRWIVYYGLPQEPPPYSEYSPLTLAQKKNLNAEQIKAQEQARSKKRGAFIEAINRPRFCLYDRVAKKRYLLAEQPKFETTTFAWTRDSRRLIFMTKTYNEELRQENAIGRARISLLDVTGDVTTQVSKPLTTLEAVDARPNIHTYSGQQFQIAGVSRDHRYLFVTSAVWSAPDKSGMSMTTGTWHAIDLQDGSDIILTRATGGSGDDWHDESLAPDTLVSATKSTAGGKQP